MSGSSTVKLYGHWSSSCSRRVRFALNLTGLKYEYKPVVSVTDPDFLKLNPMGYVPVLVDDIVVVSDSLAILLYLGEKYNQCCLLPRDLQKRAINYQVASIVTSSIQPLQNMSIVNYIGEKTDPDEKLHWAQSHIRKGFVALEKLLADHAGKYATGDEIYLGDVFLAPQLDNGINRFKLDMTPFPVLSRLNENYSELPAYKQAKEEF